MMIATRFLVSLVVLGSVSSVNAAPVSAQAAIECAGTTTVLPSGDKIPGSRVYIIDDRSQTVFQWDAAAQAKVPICIIGECPKKFGANQIRVVQEASGGSMVLDIERDTGAIMHLKRSSSPARMETFEGSCEKTAMPRASGAKKF